MNSLIVAGLKIACSASAGGFGVVVPIISGGVLGPKDPYLPPNLGVNGAALAACEDIADVFPETERIDGVKAGDSTFKDFFLFNLR